MCLNEKLTYDIKIKSKNCELFVMKKNDFLRLSVNFQEFIGKFLHKSLMKYLKFTEEKNKIIKEFEAMNDKGNSSQKNGDKNDSPGQNLQLIEEDQDIIEEEEGIDRSYNSAEEEEDKADIIKPQFEHKPTLQRRKSFDTGVASLNMNKIVNDPNSKSDEPKEQADDIHMDSIKDQLDSKFQKKIDKIIEFLNNDNCKLESTEVNPKELLMQLKSEESLATKYKLIDQIEIVLKEMYSSNNCNKDNEQK